MKKVLGSITHIVCILSIFASLISFTIAGIRIINIYSKCEGFCVLNINPFPYSYILSGIGFIVIAVITYMVGKRLKKVI